MSAWIPAFAGMTDLHGFLRPLARDVVQDDGAGGGYVQRADAAAQRHAHDRVAHLPHTRPHPTRLVAHDDAAWRVVGHGVERRLGGGVKPDDVHAVRPQGLERPCEVGDGDHGRAQAGAGGGAGQPAGERRAATLRHDHAGAAAGLERPDQRAHVADILDLIRGQDQRRLCASGLGLQQVAHPGTGGCVQRGHDALVVAAEGLRVQLGRIDKGHRHAGLARQLAQRRRGVGGAAGDQEPL